MSTLWVTVIFTATLITNIIGFLGTLSLIYWVGDVKTGKVLKYHDEIQYGISLVFIGYVFMQYAINVQFRPVIYRLDLVFTNVLICASFIFCLIMISRVYWVVIAALTAGFMFVAYGITRQALIAFAVEVVVQYLLARFGRQIWSRRDIIYLLFVVYACAAIAGIAFLGQHDWEFWTREILALAIEGVVFYEYARLIINRRRKADQFRQAATTDTMTGLRNFGTFNEDLAQHYARFIAGGKPYALFELDVDHFKHINDQYGHLKGNEVLMKVAQTISQYAAELENEATAYRMGGEEFGLLIAGADTEVDMRGVLVAQELQQRLRGLRFDSPQGKFRITISVGEDISSQDDHNFIAIYNRTDHYLYEAKNAGRDRINVRGQRLSLN